MLLLPEFFWDGNLANVARSSFQIPQGYPKFNI